MSSSDVAKGRGHRLEQRELRRATHSARFVILSALILEVQSPRLAGDIQASPLLFAGIASTALILRLRQTGTSARLLGSPPLFLLATYCGWCILSSFWSATPQESIVQGVLLLIALLFAASLSNIPGPIFALELVRISVLLALISWAMVPLLPQIAVLPDVVWRLNGPMEHSQRLALFVGAGIVTLTHIAAGRNFKQLSRHAGAAYFVILAITLVATQTRAFSAFTAIVVGLILIGRLRPWQQTGIAITLVAVTITIVRNWDQVLVLVNRDGTNTMTLTGRTTIWENAIKMIAEHPVIGYGYSSFYSDLTRGFFRGGYIAPHAHNTWINSWFETGLVGVVLLTAFMVAVLLYRPNGAATLGAALMLLSALCGLMGIVFGGKLSTLWVIVAVAVAQSVREGETVRKRLPIALSIGAQPPPGNAWTFNSAR